MDCPGDRILSNRDFPLKISAIRVHCVDCIASQGTYPVHAGNNGVSPIDGVFCSGVSTNVDRAMVRLHVHKKNQNSKKVRVYCAYSG